MEAAASCLWRNRPRRILLRKQNSAEPISMRTQETRRDRARRAIRCLAVLAAVPWLFASTAMSSGAAGAQGPRAAVFDLDFVDTSQEGASGRVRDDEARRLALVSDTLRRMLAERGVTVVDVAPARGRIEAGAPLTRCNGCDLDLARELGAELAVIGFVQKVSNLILNINVTVRDARSGQTVRAASVDIRGNTDESWSRGISYLVRNRLFDPPLRLPAP
jgi:hypothetical protein